MGFDWWVVWKWMDRFLLLHVFSLVNALASAFSHGATLGSREMMAPKYPVLFSVQQLYQEWHVVVGLAPRCHLRITSLSSGKIFMMEFIVFYYVVYLVALFTIKSEGFCQSAKWQCSNHTVSEKEMLGVLRYHGMLSEGEKREKEGGF